MLEILAILITNFQIFYRLEELEEAESNDKDEIESTENTGVVECYVIHSKCTFRKCTQQLKCKPKDVEN